MDTTTLMQGYNDAKALAEHYRDGRECERNLSDRLAEVLEILAIDANENDAYLIGLALAEYREARQ